MTRFGSFAEILAADGDDPPPEFRRHPGVADVAPREVPREVHTSREWHEREKARLWSRIWQVACREEHVAPPGDQHVYDVADRSYLVVRGRDGRIRAFVNACLHRGRRLRDYPGHAPSIRCAFHGFTWDLEGAIRGIPCRGDFPGVTDDDWRLPEIAVGTWGGFVFVNPDPQAEPLERFLGELDAHFARWPLGERHLAKHVAKLLRCNWKVAQEAFMEAYHVFATHPQSAWATGDGPLSQYDAFGNFSRAITPRGVPSPHPPRDVTEQQILDALRVLGRDDRVPIPEGARARALHAAAQKRDLARTIGEAKAAALGASEVCDLLYYTVFPDFHPWGAYYQSIYLFRPNGDDHRSCVMEFMLLAPVQGERPPPAPLGTLGFDDSRTAAVGPRGRIFYQDSLNMPRVQQGLETTARPTVRLAQRQEGKMRHFYTLYARMVGLGEAVPQTRRA